MNDVEFRKLLDAEPPVVVPLNIGLTGVMNRNKLFLDFEGFNIAISNTKWGKLFTGLTNPSDPKHSGQGFKWKDISEFTVVNTKTMGQRICFNLHAYDQTREKRNAMDIMNRHKGYDVWIRGADSEGVTARSCLFTIPELAKLLNYWRDRALQGK